MDRHRILFVCLGNICRSPLGEGILRLKADERGVGNRISVGSAGTGGWHCGEAPDRRSIEVGQKYGVDISRLKARKIRPRDFHDFDMIFAMDRSNLRDLVRITPHDSHADLHLFMDFVSGQQRDVPDPYHGGEQDFEVVYRMLDNGCEFLLDHLFPVRKNLIPA